MFERYGIYCEKHKMTYWWGRSEKKNDQNSLICQEIYGNSHNPILYNHDKQKSITKRPKIFGLKKEEEQIRNLRLQWAEVYRYLRV